MSNKPGNKLWLGSDGLGLILNWKKGSLWFPGYIGVGPEPLLQTAKPVLVFKSAKLFPKPLKVSHG